MNFLAALEATAFSEWVLTSMLGFPTLIALHSIGMAVAAGLSFVVALYLNGFVAGSSGAHLPRFLHLATLGFILNFVTGLALFVARGSDYITNTTFLVKMLLVVISGAILVWLKSSLAEFTGAPHEPRSDALARHLSLVCSVTWIGAIVSGRLIAYLGTVY